MRHGQLALREDESGGRVGQQHVEGVEEGGALRLWVSGRGRADVGGVGDAGVNDVKVGALDERQTVVGAAAARLLQGGEDVVDELDVLQGVAGNELLRVRGRWGHYEILAELCDRTTPTLCGQVRKREDCAQRIDHLLFGSHLSVTTKPNSDGVVELHQFFVLFEKIRRVLSLLHFHDPVLVLQGLSHLILLPGHFDHIAQRVQMVRGLLQNGLEALLCFANLFMIR